MSTGENHRVTETVIQMPIQPEPKGPLESTVDPTRIQTGPFTPSQQEATDEELREKYRAAVENYNWSTSSFQDESAEFTPGNVDVKELLSCQAEFIEEQTRFLHQGVHLRGEEFIQALTLYSKSQGKLLKAQQDVLRQLRVI